MAECFTGKKACTAKKRTGLKLGAHVQQMAGEAGRASEL